MSSYRADGSVATGYITREAIQRLLGRAIGGVLSLIAVHLAVRHFGIAQWGEIVAATAWVGIFAVLGELGAGTAGARDFPDPNSSPSSAIGATFIVGLLGSVVALVIMVPAGLVVYLHHPAVRSLVLLLAPFVPFSVIWTVSGVLLAAYKRSDLRGVLDVLSSIVVLVTAALVLTDDLGTSWYVLGLVAEAGITAVVAVVLLSRVVAVRWPRGELRRRVHERLVATRVVAIVVVVSLLYAYVDVVLLSVLSTSAQVGYYGIASQIAGFAMTVPGFVLSPAVARFTGGDDAARSRLMQYLIDLLLGTVLPAAALLAVFARPIVIVIGGSSAAGSASSLQLLLVSTVPLFAASPFASALVWIKCEGVAARIYLVALIVNGALNVAVDPHLGARGASLAMIASEATVFVLSATSFCARTGFRPRPRIPMISAGAAMVIIACWQLVLHT